MKSISAILFVTALLFTSANAQILPSVGKKLSFPIKDLRNLTYENSKELDSALKIAVSDTIKSLENEKIKLDEIAATIVDLTDSKSLKTANYNGEMQMYPASVVKMFYLAAIHRQLEDGKIKLTPELERGLKDMIEVSSNDATQYILDVLTDTASGGELPEKAFKEWAFKRNAVNRYYSSLGYSNINVNQKTYCEDAYGREQQFRNFRGENRNMLTTNATARLLSEIALLQSVSKDRSLQMLELLRRDPFAATNDNEDQAHGFTGISLVELGLKDSKLFSKAGWTSSTRHDAAYIETPDGNRFVIVVFTKNHASERRIIPGIATKVLRKFKAKD